MGRIIMGLKRKFLFLMPLLALIIFFCSCSNNSSTGANSSPGNTNSDVSVTVVGGLVLTQIGTSSIVTMTFISSNPAFPIYDLVINDINLPSGWTLISSINSFGNRAEPYCKGEVTNLCTLVFQYSPVALSTFSSKNLSHKKESSHKKELFYKKEFYSDTKVATDPCLETQCSFTVSGSAIKSDRKTLVSFSHLITYQATTNNTVTAVVNPSDSVIYTMIYTAKIVTVTFGTSDNRPVSNFSITLPSATGWTRVTTLPLCAEVISSNTACTNVLTLQYAPNVAATSSSIYTINYSYKANNSSSKSGSVNIVYQPVVANTLSVSLNPSSYPNISGYVGYDYDVIATFTVNPSGTTVNGFTINSPSASGWSTIANTCGTSITTSCSKTYRYHPTSSTNVNLLPFNYSYIPNNSLNSVSSSFNISYKALNETIPSPNSLTFTGPGYQTVSMSTTDGLPVQFSSFSYSGDIYVQNNSCENQYVSVCYFDVVYNGNYNGSDSVYWNYIPSGSGSFTSGSVPVSYSTTPVYLQYSPVAQALTSVDYNGGYVVYQVTMSSGEPFNPIYINGDSTSYPSGMNRVDSSTLAPNYFYPSCDSAYTYSYTCYVAFQYFPQFSGSSTPIDSTFDYNGNYYINYFYSLDLTIPSISYSTTSLNGSLQTYYPNPGIDFTNTQVNDTKYALYYVTKNNGNSFSYGTSLAYFNPSLPAGLSLIDSNSYPFYAYPSCGDGYSAVGYSYCYIVYQYSPSNPDGGSYNFDATYSENGSPYYLYYNLSFPTIDYSAIMPGGPGNISFPTWPINYGSAPVTQDLSSSGTTNPVASINVSYDGQVRNYTFTITAPSVQTMIINSTNFNPVFTNYQGGMVTNVSDGCSGFSGGTSCSVSFDYQPSNGQFEDGYITYDFQYQPSDTNINNFDQLYIDFHAN